MSFLSVSDIVKTYPGVVALGGVSFAVERQRVHGLMGENGAGKSTLIKILGGDIRPDSGELRLGGVPKVFASTRDAFRAGVAVVHQELQLVPELTVAENLWLGRFPGRLGIVDYRQVVDKVAAVLDEIGIDVDPRARIAALSIGARQMVEIAKAVMMDASVIALDEPTSSLSSSESEVLFRIIRRLRAEGRILLYVSHRMDEIFELCDGCTVFRDGRVAAHHPTMQDVTRDRLVREMVGREIADIWGWRPRPAGEVRLAVEELRGPRLPRPASFTARAGEIVGFFGLVGAGRSELMRLVYGADPATGGQVAIDGVDKGARDPRRSIRQGVVLCPEDRKAEGIIQGRSIEENINISARRHTSRCGVLHGRQEAGTADDFIAKLRIRTPSRHQDIVNLSGGNQQKVILSRWLAERDVKVLIVDEPTRGIDVGAKAEIYGILYELAAAGFAIVVVSSELPEVMGISDRILVMREGAIVREFARAAFDEQAILGAALPLEVLTTQNHQEARA